MQRTRPLEAGNRPEASSIGEHEGCSVPLGQRQTPHFGDADAKVDRMGGFIAFATQP